MYGFLFSLNNNIDSELLSNGKIIKEDKFCLYYNPLPKFENDKILDNTDEQLLLLDGVIYNKAELLAESDSKSWSNYCINQSNKNFDAFLNSLRGIFNGILFNKKTGRVIAFTNYLGEKAIFWHAEKSELIVASHMGIMREAYYKLGKKVSESLQACREMLVTGSYLHGNTFVSDVKRLMGGTYLEFKDDGISINRYHIFKNTPEWDMSLDECIEKAEDLFQRAVKRIYLKNEEYGYELESDLSGGVDSRLATFVLHDIANKPFLNICWCQSGKIDNISSKKMAKDLGNIYKFYPMDGGDFLKDVDRMINVTGGQIIYTSSTCANRVFSEIDTSNIGFAVTGLLGETHNAYWTEGETHTPPRFTTKYTDATTVVIPDNYSEEYDNYEQMNLYELSSLTFLSSSFTRQQMVEVCSPFIDKDFMEFAFRIPLKFRKNDNFTLNWYVKKHPVAAKYVWQNTLKPIDKSLTGAFYFPKIVWDIERNFTRVVNKICKVLKIPYRKTLRNDMNPFETWYTTNKSIKKFYQDYYLENRDLVKDKSLREDMLKMMKTGRCYDAMLVVNLLGTYKYWLSKK